MAPPRLVEPGMINIRIEARRQGDQRSFRSLYRAIKAALQED